MNENDNKIYFITKDGFKFTSIKIYFQKKLIIMRLFNFIENTIINAFSPYPCTVVPNTLERSVSVILPS